MLNVVGHALRTPITTLCGLADELAQRAEDPAARTVLAEAVQRNGRIVERLLDDLLVASGVTTALPVSEPEAIDLRAAAEQVWARLGDPRPLVVEGGATALAQQEVVDGILEKLLENALRYGRGEVIVRAREEGGSARISVRSQGSLPTGEELALAPEPFYRGEHAVMAAPGLGIGLTVAQTLAFHAKGSVGIAVEGDVFVAEVDLPAA